MRWPVAFGLVLVAISAAHCQCGGDVTPPPPAIGDGDPIGPPDAGDIYLADAGPVVCEEDANEDNDTRATAVDVATGTASGRSCGDDDDWYSVASQPNCSVLAQLEQGEGTGDIDMLMFDPDGQLVGSSAHPGTTEAINAPASKSGPYAVRLRSGSRDNVPYTLTLTSTCASDLTCPADDALEPNDSSAQPANLNVGVAADGILCGLDEDWFLMPATLGCVADAHIDFVHTQGDIDLELYDADGVTRVANSAGTGDSERITKVVTEGGMRFHALIFSAQSASANGYRFVVNQICAGQIACPTDDPFEPNDTRAQARRLFAPKDEVIGVTCGNDDFYDLIPQSGCTVHATMTFVDASGDLDLELQNGADGARIAISQTQGDSESIDYNATSAAKVVLRVFGFQNASNSYRLHVESTCP